MYVNEEQLTNVEMYEQKPIIQVLTTIEFLRGFNGEPFNLMYTRALLNKSGFTARVRNCPP